jgi:hypothetical protein
MNGRAPLLAAILSVTAATAIAVADPSETRIIVQIELALVGVVAVGAVVAALRHAAPLAPPSAFDRADHRPPPVSQQLPVDLVRISRRLTVAQASLADTRRHLAPLVAAIAADRLRGRAHTEIDPESVYLHLPRPVPDALARLLDPAFDDLDTRDMAGLDAAGSDAVVRALEQL